MPLNAGLYSTIRSVMADNDFAFTRAITSATHA